MRADTLASEVEIINRGRLIDVTGELQFASIIIIVRTNPCMFTKCDGSLILSSRKLGLHI